jgi:hypothetical protein
MALPLIPLAVAAVAGVSALAVHHRSKKKQLTPAREKIFNTAMNNLKEPEKLTKLSQAYQQQGLTEQATALAKRAKLRALPKDVKAARRAIFKKTLTLKNPAQVKKIASAFQGEGCTGAAEALNQYAAGLPRE